MNKKLFLILILILILLLGACGAGGNESAEPKRPDFEEHNIAINLKEDEPASYTTSCKTDPTKKTTGTLTVSTPVHFKGESALPENTMQPLEGYEWIQVNIETVFADDNAKDFGVDRSSCVSNYYDLKYFENNLEYNSSAVSKFAVFFNEQEYTECQFIKVLDNQGWTKEMKNILNYTWYFRVPEGYDGMVIAFLDAGITWEKGKQIYEVLDANSLVFRVK